MNKKSQKSQVSSAFFQRSMFFNHLTIVTCIVTFYVVSGTCRSTCMYIDL